MSDIKEISNKEQFPLHDDIEDGTFLFDEDEFDMTFFLRYTVGKPSNIPDFIWKNKGGLTYCIRIEPPYRIHVEQIACSDTQNLSMPCNVLKFIKNK